MLSEDGSSVPFVIRDQSLHFFAGTPGVVRVVSGDHEYIYSLTLPELGDAKWDPPATPAAAFRECRLRWPLRRICGRGWQSRVV